MLTVASGAILFVAGLLYLVRETLGHRRLSDPHGPGQTGSTSGPKPTLEPRRQGVGFLGLGRNWPGLALMAVGAILLVSEAYI